MASFSLNSQQQEAIQKLFTEVVPITVNMYVGINSRNNQQQAWETNIKK